MTSEVNQAFALPPELEAMLRAKAAALVAEATDEDALLTQYVAEAQAARTAALRAKAAVLAASPAQSIDGHGFPKEYAEIVIYKGRGKEELSYVPFGVNGYFWRIMRGVRVIVPKVVVGNLEHAVTEEVIQAEGGLITQPVHRFPWQTIRDSVPETEYLAFREKMKAAGAAAAVAIS